MCLENMLLMIQVIDGKKHFCFPVTSVAVYNKSETFGIVSNLGIRIFGIDVGLDKTNLTIMMKNVKKLTQKRIDLIIISKSTFDKFNSKTCYTRIFCIKISISDPGGVYKKIVIIQLFLNKDLA